MRKIIFKCDRCNFEQEVTADEHGSFDYRGVKIKTVTILVDDADSIRFELCPKCLNDLKANYKK